MFSKRAQHPLNIIAIAASSGDHKALQDFFSYLPPLNDTCVLVPQHFSSSIEKKLARLLSKKTSLTLTQAAEGQNLEQNKVYFLPFGKDITVADGKIHILDPASAIRPNPSVDLLFHSLTETKNTVVVGVVLSGSWTDGAAGIKSLKNNGAYIIAQETETAKLDGLLQSGLVDVVLAPNNMGRHLFDKLFQENKIKPATAPKNKHPTPPKTKLKEKSRESSLSGMIKDTLFQTFEYPYVVVNADFNIVEL